MHTRSLFFLLLFSLSAHANFILKQADTLTLTDAHRGFAIVNEPHSTHIFNYETKKKQPHAQNNPLHYYQQLELNDNKTLVMHSKDKKNSSLIELDFFMGTRAIQAKSVGESFILLAAQTSKGGLKIALLDKEKIRFSQTLSELSVEKIYAMFTHLDGSYSVALKTNNYKNRLSYFDRGTGSSNIVILHFSPLLHLLKKHFIGDSNLGSTVQVLKDECENYTIISQEKRNELNFYRHNLYKDSNEKSTYKLQEEQEIQSVSTEDFKTFYLGTKKNLWLSLDTSNEKILSYELTKIKDGQIRFISKLADNSLLISGTYLSERGESDLFIHNYSPKKTLLWGESYQSDFNDLVIQQQVDLTNIFLTTLVNDKKNIPTVAQFRLDYRGKVLKR